MLITRRTMLVGAALSGACLLLPHSRASAGGLFEGVPLGEAPGDYGYRHAEYHAEYQRIFGELGHCSCGAGDCRVTDWRETELGSPHGYDIIAYRRWLPLPESVWIPTPEQVPQILRRERAHVCAYDMGTISIPCVIINVTQT